MTPLLRHLRANLVGYIALFVALAGTSYAAFRLPANSVGERQLRNHSIDPVKLNGRFFGGYVRAWAEVSAAGRVVASGGRVRVSTTSDNPGVYALRWSVGRPSTRCTSVVSIDGHGQPNSAAPNGYAVTGTSFPASGLSTGVATYAPQGTLQALPFDVLLVC